VIVITTLAGMRINADVYVNEPRSGDM